jgi:aspartate 1-decarboxylase
MLITLLKSKIHRATVTHCNLNYEGSIGIDKKLMDEVGLAPYEQVDIYNINNGARLTTYVIEEKANSGIISIRGSAARLAQIGDLVIICSYCQLNEQEAKKFKPTVKLVDAKNKVVRKISK